MRFVDFKNEKFNKLAKGAVEQYLNNAYKKVKQTKASKQEETSNANTAILKNNKDVFRSFKQSVKSAMEAITDYVSGRSKQEKELYLQMEYAGIFKVNAFQLAHALVNSLAKTTPYNPHQPNNVWKLGYLSLPVKEKSVDKNWVYKKFYCVYNGGTYKPADHMLGIEKNYEEKFFDYNLGMCNSGQLFVVGQATNGFIDRTDVSKEYSEYYQKLSEEGYEYPAICVGDKNSLVNNAILSVVGNHLVKMDILPNNAVVKEAMGADYVEYTSSEIAPVNAEHNINVKYTNFVIDECNHKQDSVEVQVPALTEHKSDTMDLRPCKVYNDEFWNASF